MSPLPPRSLSPSTYKAWESQPFEIRSQFQPVPTERSYQDGACRMEYFKLYLSPDRGRLIAATSRGCRGGVGREVGAPKTPRSQPSGRTPLRVGPPVPSPDAGAQPAVEIRLRRAWHRARGTRRGVKVGGAAAGRAGRVGDGRRWGAGEGRRGSGTADGRAKFDSRLICRGLLCFLLDMSLAPRALAAAASSPWRVAAGGGGVAEPRDGSYPRSLVSTAPRRAPPSSSGPSGAASEAGGSALRCKRADRRGRRAAGCCQSSAPAQTPPPPLSFSQWNLRAARGEPGGSDPGATGGRAGRGGTCSSRAPRLQTRLPPWPRPGDRVPAPACSELAPPLARRHGPPPVSWPRLHCTVFAPRPRPRPWIDLWPRLFLRFCSFASRPLWDLILSRRDRGTASGPPPGLSGPAPRR